MSIVFIVVFLYVEEVEMDIKEEDVCIDIMCVSGVGG